MAQESEKKGLGGTIANIPTFFSQVAAERRKVVWPSRRETIMTAFMVVVLTLMLSIFFFTVDWGFSRIVRFLLSLVQG